MADILVAEDEKGIREGLGVLLESHGHTVRLAADGAEALEAYARKRPDILLLDVMMPKVSGYEVCMRIRKTDGALPVLMLTAKTSEEDKVLGLGLGADDYITKPFGRKSRELLARIDAALARSARLEAPPKADADEDIRVVSDAPFPIGKWTVEPAFMRVTAPRRTAFRISTKELDLLRLFSSHPNEVLSREFLSKEVWGQAFTSTRTIDQFVLRLRRRFEDGGNLFAAVYGVGYRYCPRAR